VDILKPKDLPTPVSNHFLHVLTYTFNFFQYYVRNMTDDAHEHSVMHQDLKNVVSMDYHYKNGDLYYADVSAKIIYRYGSFFVTIRNIVLRCNPKVSLVSRMKY
jgi:hypothetical protein